ncbi:MAG: hypothetical protein ACNS60_04345 [Candidatus Cyclobacteriaceae bacterium M2_1C_046]
MNSLLRTTFFISFLLLSLPGFSQVSEAIRTDRPSQSFSQYTVGMRILQLEGGIGYGELGTDLTETSSLYENLVIRYGIKENIELNASVTYTSSTYTPFIGNEVDINGLSQFDFGFRIHLFERPSGFAGSWQTRARFHFIQNEEFEIGDNDLGYVSAVSMGYPVGNSLFVANVGTSDTSPFLYTFNYSRSIGDSFSAFVEVYGIYENEFNNFFDGGVAYFINKDLQLDISAGVDLENTIDGYFVEGGISSRIFGLK